jgi:hypothetical protein
MMPTAMGRWIGVSLAVSVAALGGCAAKRQPTPKVQAAEVAYREAEVSGAAQYAPLELRLAREKLDLARRALNDDDRDRARRLSDEALVDAQLAEAKANSEKARRNAEEVRKSIDALRSEATRPVDDTR